MTTSASRPLPPDLHQAFSLDLELGEPCSAGELAEAVRNKASFYDQKIRWAAEGSSGALEMIYFDELVVTPAAAIHDGILGTIGLVHFLPEETSELKAWLREQLETAAYLKHLCMEWTRPDQPHLGVEVVFVAHDDSVSADLLAVFREVMEQTSLMHGLGVGVMNLSDLRSVEDRPRVLSRAFPWLLRATRRWIQSQPGCRKSGDDAGRLQELRLENFRIAGTRSLRLARDTQIHLIHGQNGSGKSSISEALELAITGKTKRMEKHSTENERDYLGVLRNKDAAGAPKITLKLGNQLFEFAVKKSGVATPLIPNLSPLAFRLDQDDVSKLTKDPRGTRAAMFLQAFFPEHRETAKIYHATRDDITRIRASIPSAMLEGTPDPLIAAFDLVQLVKEDPFAIYALLDPQRIIPMPVAGLSGRMIFDWDGFISRMPDYRHFKLRSQDLPANASEGLIAEFLQMLDYVWDDLSRKSGTYREHLLIAAEFMERLAGWQARESSKRESDGPKVEDYFERMNIWLRECALCDLLSQKIAMEKVLARLDKDTLSEIARDELFRPVSLSLLEERLAHHRKAREEAKHDLEFGDFVDPSLRKGRQEGLRIHPREISALNWVGHYFQIPPGQHGSLGDAIRTALQQDIRISIERPGLSMPLEIGRPRTESLNRFADDMKQQAAHFERFASPGNLSLVPPSRCYDSIKKLAVAIRRASSEGTTAYEAFTRSVNKELSDAINELTALMTPARWAYPDIKTNLKGEEFGQQVGSTPAELFLNTAEQNAATISLFLLCAFGLKENTTRSIILDDPFENMDELTTTQVARAITRFLRLWNKEAGGDSWQIIMLLHGAENTERMREETPCETYFLPWLAPGNVPDHDGEIESEKKRFTLLPSLEAR